MDENPSDGPGCARPQWPGHGKRPRPSLRRRLSAWLRPLISVACLLGALPVKAGVSVYGTASSSGEHITVDVLADITTAEIVSYCFKVFYDPSILQLVNAARNETVWYLHDGTKAVPYEKPDTSRPGEVLFVGGMMDARSPKLGVSGNQVRLATLVLRRLNPNVPSFSVLIGRKGQYANFVTKQGVTLDATPGEVSFSGVAPDRNDRDLDGLSDKWENTFFGGTKQAYFSDDTDHDGANNLSEQAAGSDPTDQSSSLHLSVWRGRKGVLLEWPSATDRVYTIEASDDLRKFRAIKTGVEATPPNNTFELSGEAEAAFYRIRLEGTVPR